MGKRTKKVGISGKYGTRYGASLRKIVRKIEVTQHATVSIFAWKRVHVHGGVSFAAAGSSTHVDISYILQYTCVFCGKESVKRQAVGIWNCKHCKKTQTGGAFMLATAAAATVRSNIARLRKGVEEA